MKIGGFSWLFSTSKKNAKPSKGVKGKKGKTQKNRPKSIIVKQTGSYNNEPDCQQALRKSKKNGKCVLVGVGSYVVETETRV
jgi:hypothetical protein